MILRRISFERFGCFGTAEFEFRRGFNLLSGENDSGKSLLLAALPAAVLGVEHGSRLRSWGDTLNCRVTLLFEGGEGGVRLSRDLESNLVRLEENRTGSWRECFAGKLPPGTENADYGDYLCELERLFSIRGEALMRALLDAANPEAVLTADGRLADGLVAAGAADDERSRPMAAASADPAQREQEIQALEAELAVDREDYRKGQDYLAWIRKRWEREAKTAPASGKNAGKTAKKDADLERQRAELLARLKEQGLPAKLPADLPAMFETAEGLRQELAALQLELTPLQRRRSGVVMPGLLWPLLTTVIGAAGPGAAYWLKQPWWLPLAGGCSIALLIIWGVFLVRLNRARGERDLLDQQLQGVEIRRADALARQSELAEQFEFCGLPSAPVEMVKLEQLYRRNEALIRQYHDVCARLGADGTSVPGSGETPAGDRHLRPEELPEAEARLAELGESLRRREARLNALRNGTATAAGADTSSTPWPVWTEKQLLQSICQHLERLTAGRHRDIRVEEGGLRLEVAPGRWAAPSSCSRGTRDALVLAIRLACARLSGGLLPLTVDDLSAHDARRQQAVLRELERFAVEHQLLFASCDEDLARRGGRERWHVISLKQAPNQRPATTEEDSDAGQLHLL
ncbi:MAG: hypothetical protein FDZ69_03560 [Deltaproteobacteria bacterium]|nr:MAG: hypothetical protein FDZ69_03560 [Deltaproteobacteria bacterium]